MKHFKLTAACVALLMLLSTVGCSTKPFPEPELTHEVLFGAENADPCGAVLCFELHVPSNGTSFLSDALTQRAYFTVSGEACQKIKFTDLPPSQPKLSKKVKAEWNQKLHASGTALGVWPDTGLWLVDVPEGSTYLNEKKEEFTPEYAGKTVVCEVTDGEVCYNVLPASGAQTEFLSAYSGRIGDKYFGPYWWYDLTAHEVKLYASADELPPVVNVTPPKWKDLTFPDGRTIAELVGEVYGVGELIDRFGDTAYYFFGEFQRYKEPDGSYNGDRAYFVVYDCQTDVVLRVERYDCANLNIRAARVLEENNGQLSSFGGRE